MSNAGRSGASLILVNGSPRKNGNTAILLERIARGYVNRGGSTKTIRLQDSGIGYCTGCFSCLCQRRRPCVLKDSMDAIYNELLEAQAVVLGTPVYFWGPSAQMKVFLDRLFPFGDFQTTSWAKALLGVPFVVVLVHADEDPLTSGAELAYRQIKVVVECVGGSIARFLHFSANEAGDICKNDRALKAAEEAGAVLYERPGSGSHGQARQ